MTGLPERSERDKRLDDLAQRVSNILQGQSYDDVVNVAAAICGYAIAYANDTKEKRERTLEKAFDFIRKTMNDAVEEQNRTLQ